MPLLLIDPSNGPLPPEADVAVPADVARHVRVAQGQLLTIEATDGGQVASLFAWNAGDRDEWLSPHHTRVSGGTFALRMGTRLVTNRRRPMLVIGRDSVRRHDLLLPASAATVTAVEAELARIGLEVPRVADPIGLFLHSVLGDDGRIDVGASPARPGDRVTMRVLVDADVIVAATPTGLAGASADPPGRLRILVHNEVAQLDGVTRDGPARPPATSG